MIPKIVKTEELPSTVNGWGFGGSIGKVRYIMDNGDVWVKGTACYRHLPSEKYIQLRSATSDKKWAEMEDWEGGIANDRDVLLKGSAENHIIKYYKLQEN